MPQHKVRRDKAYPDPTAHAYGKREVNVISYFVLYKYTPERPAPPRYCVAADLAVGVSLLTVVVGATQFLNKERNVPSHGVEPLNRPGPSPGSPRANERYITTTTTTTAAATKQMWR